MSQGKNSSEKASYRPRKFGSRIKLVWFPLLQSHVFTAGVGNTKKRQCEEFPSISKAGMGPSAYVPSRNNPVS